MEKLEIKYAGLGNALAAFEEAIKRFKRVEQSSDQEELDTYRDSVIKRFEFSIDFSWKYLKQYMEEVLGIVLEKSGPKPTFREAFKGKIINEDQTRFAIEMVDSRNLTSHIYREEVADKICARASEYLQLMQKIFKKIQPK